MFLEGRQSNTEILNMFDNDNHAPRCESKNQEEDGVPVTSEGSRHNLNSAPTMTVRSSTKAPSLTELSPGPQNEFSDDAVELNELPTWEEPVLVAFDSVKSTWEENIELSWVKVQTRDNLLAVRNFLKNGIDLAVMEEKVLSFPAEPAPGEERMESPSGKKGKDTKVKKDDKPDDGKKKGKKKEPEVAMTSMPAEYVVLAKFHLPLADLLDGETKVEAILTKSASEIGGRESPQISETESKKMEKKEKKKAGDKGKGQDKDKKGKGSKVPAETNTEDEEAAPPVPLELQVSLRLHHWTTARDCGQTIEGEDDGAEEEKSLAPPSKGK
ncbi:hypothetical protein CAPTEDRAFT_222609 [Capitella teleta]|uniref:Uncharacterized protein n=1 Tax=Capitella teleta TaxID=283909 RepID=R7UDH3_CAPTE|nr:hypothetical protein CAPTEDRAFT_222609 [Capitella teleta]|eukprot:ELU04415.1 hypothetical protein CAPTEDRAFT_222609 [Capitella teleta]